MDFSLTTTHQDAPLLTRLRCPLCASTTLTPFLRRESVPTLTNLLMETQEAARHVQRGDMLLLVCQDCGFVFNGAFTPSALYNEGYENSQVHAPTFERYLDALVRSLVKEQQVHHCRIVEVGCGDGSFLRKLVEAGPGNSGLGFDPAYCGPACALDGRLRFVARYYDETCDALEADILICRHVIEHIPRPIPFLRTLRRAVANSSCTRAFFETPDITWILHNGVMWDIYYEHCSYFSAETFTLALERSGFQVQRVRRSFGDQYLWVETTISEQEPCSPTRFDPGSLLSLAAQFQRHEQQFREQWQQTIHRLSYYGPVALLGAAGKGVTLANLVDPDAQLIACVVDLNPKKQQKFLPGTGHPIVAYEDMRTYGVVNAVLLNPNYFDDAVRILKRHQLSIHLVADPVTHRSAPGVKYEREAALQVLREKVEQARRAGKTIVFTNGVFDLLHSGHLQFLRYAKTLGDVLIVAVDSDASAHRLKGPGRPINTEQDRLMLVAALTMVDAALLFEGEALAEVIRSLRPHIYVKGNDYRGQPSPAAEALEETGTRCVIAPPTRPDLHTSRIVERILAQAPNRL